MKNLCLTCMLILLTACFEKPIDVRNFYFPSKTINYDLVNTKDIEDVINVDVSVMTVTPEVIYVIKDYKKMGTKTFEVFEIGEDEIKKTSHKVDDVETLSSPISFNRMIKTGEQLGPRADAIFGKHLTDPVRDCFLTGTDHETNQGLVVKLIGKQETRLMLADGSETYCQGLGLGSLELGDKEYLVDAKKLSSICSKKIRTNGSKSTLFECNF